MASRSPSAERCICTAYEMPTSAPDRVFAEQSSASVDDEFGRPLRRRDSPATTQPDRCRVCEVLLRPAVGPTPRSGAPDSMSGWCSTRFPAASIPRLRCRRAPRHSARRDHRRPLDRLDRPTDGHAGDAPISVRVAVLVACPVGDVPAPAARRPRPTSDRGSRAPAATSWASPACGAGTGRRASRRATRTRCARPSRAVRPAVLTHVRCPKRPIGSMGARRRRAHRRRCALLGGRIGGPCWDRTSDQLVKSQLLYR